MDVTAKSKTGVTVVASFDTVDVCNYQLEMKMAMCISPIQQEDVTTDVLEIITCNHDTTFTSAMQIATVLTTARTKLFSTEDVFLSKFLRRRLVDGVSHSSSSPLLHSPHADIFKAYGAPEIF